MKFLITAMALVGLVGTANAASKVGYVDVKKFIENTSVGKKAKDTLDVEYNKRKKELEKKRGDLEKMAQDLEKKKTVLSEEVYGKKRGELEEEGMKFQKNLADNNLEMQKKQAEVLEPVMDKMRTVLEKIAKEKDYAVVLEKQGPGFLYAAKDADLTDTVIQAFEKEK